MKVRTNLQTDVRRPAPARKLAAVFLASALIATGAAMAEGGGTPAGDQAAERAYQRHAEETGLASNYERAFERAHPGDPRNVVPSPRSQGRYDRSQRYSGNRSNRNYDRHHRSYAYSAPYRSPYYYDPSPSPGISLFFNF